MLLEDQQTDQDDDTTTNDKYGMSWGVGGIHPSTAQSCDTFSPFYCGLLKWPWMTLMKELEDGPLKVGVASSGKNSL